MIDVPCVTVRRTRERWGVTQQGLGWFLAEFTVWQDAVDYARALAVASQNSVLEGEDLQGRVVLRQVFSTDANGVVRVQSMSVAEAGAIPGEPAAESSVATAHPHEPGQRSLPPTGAQRSAREMPEKPSG